MREEQSPYRPVPPNIEQKVNQALAEVPGGEGWHFWCKPVGGGSGWLTDPQGQHHEIAFPEVLDWHGMGPEQLAQSIQAKIKDLQKGSSV